MPRAFSRTGAEPLPDRWWRAFGDPSLNRLVETALADNLDLKIAWDRLAQADASARKAGAALVPEVTLEAAGARSRIRSEQAGAGLTTPTTGGGAGASSTPSAAISPAAPSAVPATSGRRVTRTTRKTFTLALAAGYEVDLWGRVRATRDAARADVEATREDLSSAAVTLSAEVADAWYSLVERRAQRRLLDDQVRVSRDFLRLAELRFGQGQAAATDVLQQRRQLVATEGEIPQVEMGLALQRHRLAVLMGRAPRAIIGEERAALPSLPPLPRTGLPAALLKRRPDIRAALARVAAADRRVAAAIADRFPALRLTARAATDAERVRDLFDNWLATLAANLLAPLVDGGRRVAEVERARAVAAERLHAYQSTFLKALREVEDALERERRQQEFLQHLDRRLDLSRRTVLSARQRYVNGLTDYLPVLEALSTLQRIERERLSAALSLVRYRIALYRALAGSWTLPRPSTGLTAAAGHAGDRQ